MSNNHNGQHALVAAGCKAKLRSASWTIGSRLTNPLKWLRAGDTVALIACACMRWCVCVFCVLTCALVEKGSPHFCTRSQHTHTHMTNMLACTLKRTADILPANIHTHTHARAPKHTLVPHFPQSYCRTYIADTLYLVAFHCLGVYVCVCVCVCVGGSVCVCVLLLLPKVTFCSTAGKYGIK